MKRVLIIGSLLASVVLGLAAAGFKAELSAQTDKLQKLDTQLATKQLEVDGLVSDVDHLNSELSAIAAQAELVAQLNAEHERERQLIADTGSDWIVNSNKLQVSEHEATRTWAADALPDDAVQLLNSASRSQNSNSHKDGQFVAASKFHIGLPITAF